MKATTVLTHALNNDTKTLIRLAREEIALESAKETGGASTVARTKKALAYIKACTIRPEQAGASTVEHNGETYQSFTNGFTGFLLNPALPGLPEAKTPFDLAKCLPAGGEPVPDLPARLAEARRILAEYKASTTAAERKYRTNPPIIISKCGYNPQYLLDVCAILGGDITMYQDDNKPTSPARLESESGIAILLPVRL